MYIQYTIDPKKSTFRLHSMIVLYMIVVQSYYGKTVCNSTKWWLILQCYQLKIIWSLQRKHERLTRLCIRISNSCHIAIYKCTYVCYQQKFSTDVFKKQWCRACISTHVSCHAMAQKSASDYLQVINYYFQLKQKFNSTDITIHIVCKWLVYSGKHTRCWNANYSAYIAMWIIPSNHHMAGI